MIEEGEVAGRPAWRIRVEPNGIPSAYHWADYWIEQDRPVTLAADFFQDGEKVRTLEVDPERVLMLDLDQSNNSRMRKPQGKLPAVSWGSKWMLWFQERLSGFAFYM